MAPSEVAVAGLALSAARARFAGVNAAAAQTPEPEVVADPVAVVLVDTGLPHLDRPFEYAVPSALADAARPGVRVRVRFAGQELAGYVVERRASAGHGGRLAALGTVVSSEPVLTPEVLALARELARTYGGSLGDVLRLAVPPRHARAETALPRERPPVAPVPPVDLHAWGPYAAGPALLRHLTSGQAPWASWLAVPQVAAPERDWPAALAAAATATLAGSRGSIIVVPDGRDVAAVDAALSRALGPGHHVTLTAEQGPQARYTAWLKVLRGHVRVVVGNRSSVYAPVRDLGMVAVWDDGDDAHQEPRAPYPHVRDVAAIRCRLEGSALVLGGFVRTVAAQAMIETGPMKPVTVRPEVARASLPTVTVAGEGPEPERDAGATAARLPSLAWRTARDGLTRGPVLVQVPRRGYVPSLACATCRAPARCSDCHGPLGVPGPEDAPACRWCGRVHAAFVCPLCEGSRLRSLVVGARRTAEELGRAFPGTMVVTSGGDAVLDSVPDRPMLVIATPGAEPVARGGYAAALLLDAWALLGRSSLDAGIEALRRWAAAAALVRAGADQGRVVLCGVPDHDTLAPVEALVRWAPDWLAARELAERRPLLLPPTVTFAEVTGTRKALTEAGSAPGLPPSVVGFGPTALPDGQFRLLLRSTTGERDALAAALAAVRSRRSGRKESDPLTVRVGVADLG